MPISEGRISPEERRKRRLTANPAVNEAYQQSVVGVTFYAKTSPATDKDHKRALRMWTACRADIMEEGNPHGLVIPEKIVPGTPVPDTAVWITWIKWMAISFRGYIGEYCKKVTIDQYVRSMYAVFKRYAITQIPAETRLQVSAFLKSDQLEAIAPLTTACREKKIASNIDITIITDTAWRGQLRFYTNGMRIQFVFITALLAMSGDRPGAVIEARSYRGTNQALKWKDIKWVVVPNPSDPQHPHVHAVIRGTILKGFRLNDSKFREFFLNPEPNEYRPICAFSCLLYLAFRDNIFADIREPQQLLCPSISPEHIHHPSTRPEVADLPVVRAEEYVDQTWSISASQALRYDAYMDKLQTIAKMEGIKDKVTPYCIRRGALEHFKRDLPDDVRERMSGHVPMSQKFFKDYQSTLIRADLGAVLHKRDQNIQVINAVEQSMTMSAGRDVNAPLRLSLIGTQKLYDEPELAQLRDKEAELDKQLGQEYERVMSASEEEADTILIGVAKLQETLKDLQKQYKNSWNREYIRRSQQERVEFFDNASKRQLLGEAPWKPVPMNLTRETSPTANTLSFAIDMPVDDPLKAVIADCFDDSDLSVNEHVVMTIDRLSALPDRPFPLCYPQESPTKDNKCPVCNVVLTSRIGHGPGAHIHKCLANHYQNCANALADELYIESKCAWRDCCHSSIVWRTRREFIGHISKHLYSCSTSGLQRQCQWQPDDVPCDVDVDEEWHCHFGRDHDVNIRIDVDVDYCVLCSSWFSDEVGDRSEWEHHSITHYDQHYAPFETRVSTTLPLEPYGIVYIGETVAYTPGSGFEQAQPEFHGHIVKGVALSPMICPFCVFDCRVPVSKRMKQWISNDLFVSHLALHIVDIDQEQFCPVPSCGSTIFTKYDLLRHLVAFHRVPMLGGTNHQNERRLYLPIKDGDGFKTDSKRKHKAVANVVAKKAKTDGKRWWYCRGCKNNVSDLERHFNGSGRESKCRKGEYRERVNGALVGDVLHFTFSEDLAPTVSTWSRAEDKPYYCVPCRVQFTEEGIVEHMDGKCKKKSKYIRVKVAGKRAQDGETYKWEDWKTENGY